MINTKFYATLHIILALLLASVVMSHSIDRVTPQVISEHGIMVQAEESTIVEGRNLILTGNITVSGNSTLLLKNSIIQLSIRGEEDYHVIISGDGKLLLENSELKSVSSASHVFLHDNANVTMTDGSILKGFATIQSRGETLLNIINGRLQVEAISGNLTRLELKDSIHPEGTIHCLTEHFVAKGFTGDKMTINCTSASISGSALNSLTIYASDNIEVSSITVEEAKIHSINTFKVENSIFEELTLGGTGEAYNVVTTSTSAPEAGGQINAFPNSTINRYWYLTINVTDISGVTIPAKIVILNINSTKIVEVTADTLGKAYLPVLAEIITDSETTFMGNFIINAFYMDHSSSPKHLIMDTNKEITLVFKEVIPLPSVTHIELSKITVTVGDKLALAGWIEYPMGGELIEIQYVKPGGEKIVKAVTSFEDGTFSNEFIPDTPGEWTVYANWVGGSNYANDQQIKSRPVVFIVKERPTLQAILVRILPVLIIILSIVIAVAYLALHQRAKRYTFK